MDKYIICNLSETKFISSGNRGIGVEEDRNKAKKFTKMKAQNTLVNSMGKLVKMEGWKIIPSKEINLTDTPQVDVMQILADEEIIPCDNKEMTYSINIVYDTIIKSKIEIPNEMVRTKNHLTRVNRAITDYNHFKESAIREDFLNTNKRSASQRCKDDIFYEKLMDKRRELKEKLDTLDIVQRLLEGEEVNTKPNKGRRYVPRELNNVFETGEFPNFADWWDEVANY